MNGQTDRPASAETLGLYAEFDAWSKSVNAGDTVIHAKRMDGRFRRLKTLSQWALWLPFFLLPYLRFEGQQAVLFDIEHRQFHFFDLTVLPQDIWMLSLLLLAAAMTLFAATSVASRVWCGYFCFQTVWTDWFTWIEERIEGSPTARRKLDAGPWTWDKVRRKGIKHALWIALSILTGISFSIWFVDAHAYWKALIHFELPAVGWVVLAMFLGGTYFLAGWLREQTCFWLCPYARIQGTMTDDQTILPAYDETRGEPRGKLRPGEAAAQRGDCVDCFQCVQVCPTGVDIRKGLQLGCITCGLCIDACDAVMGKLGRERGLIRYMSLIESEGGASKKLHHHLRTWVYVAIILFSLLGIGYGLTHLGSLKLTVIPERQPLYVRMGDGDIQNKYTFKVLNKTGEDFRVDIRAEDLDVADLKIIGPEHPLIHHGRMTSFTVFVRVPADHIRKQVSRIEFYVEKVGNPGIYAEYTTKFNAPGRLGQH